MNVADADVEDAGEAAAHKLPLLLQLLIPAMVLRRCEPSHNKNGYY